MRDSSNCLSSMRDCGSPWKQPDLDITIAEQNLMRCNSVLCEGSLFTKKGTLFV